MKLTFLIVGFAALTLAATTNTDLRENIHRFSQVSEDQVTVANDAGNTPAGTAAATPGTTDTKPLNDSASASATTPKEDPKLHKCLRGRGG